MNSFHKKIAISLLVLGVISQCFAVTYHWKIIPEKIWHGKVGGNNSYYIIETDTGKKYFLGKYSDERAKQRYAMALTALTSGMKLIIQYYDGKNGTFGKEYFINNKDVVPTGLALTK